VIVIQPYRVVFNVRGPDRWGRDDWEKTVTVLGRSPGHAGVQAREVMYRMGFADGDLTLKTSEVMK
jgi:hypothetical protein